MTQSKKCLQLRFLLNEQSFMHAPVGLSQKIARVLTIPATLDPRKSKFDYSIKK